MGSKNSMHTHTQLQRLSSAVHTFYFSLASVKLRGLRLKADNETRDEREDNTPIEATKKYKEEDSIAEISVACNGAHSLCFVIRRCSDCQYMFGVCSNLLQRILLNEWVIHLSLIHI